MGGEPRSLTASRAGAAVSVALVLIAPACTRSIEPPDTIERQYEGPVRSRDVDEGARVFTTLCTACHEGRVNPRGYHWSPGQMRHQIREGNHLMPPLSRERLSDEQVEAVLAYLTVMGALEGELPAADVSGDARRGGVAEVDPVGDPEPARDSESGSGSESETEIDRDAPQLETGAGLDAPRVP